MVLDAEQIGRGSRPIYLASSTPHVTLFLQKFRPYKKKNS